MRALIGMAYFSLFVVAIPFGGPLHAADIDFEGIAPGTILDEVSEGSGITGNLNGVQVDVFGSNPDFSAGTNAAVVFDSANPTGGDVDLGTPNEVFGGPGVGAGGETSNDTALGNVLIVAENLVDSDSDDLVDDPDDADLAGAYLEFRFSKKVTVNSVTIMDVEREEGEDGTFLVLSGPGIPTSLIAIPPTGDNGVVTIDGIGLAGVKTLRVQLNGSGAVSSVVVNAGEERVCWITTGGFQNAGVQSGGKDFTFGGNVGPPPSGSWEVIDHVTGDNFHSNDVHIDSCDTIDATGPEQPGGNKGFVINRAFFSGTGRLNGEDGFPFDGFVIDAGEPSGKNGNDKDQFAITVRDPITSVVVFEAIGELDGGNVQIHPPVGNQ